MIAQLNESLCAKRFVVQNSYGVGNSQALCCSKDRRLVSFECQYTLCLAQLAAERKRLLNTCSLFRSFAWRAKCEFFQEVPCDWIRKQSGLPSPTFRNTDRGLSLGQSRIALCRHNFQSFQSHDWTSGNDLAPRSLDIDRKSVV